MTRLRPQSDLQLASEEIASASELRAVCDLWKRTHRTFAARFDGVSMQPTIQPHQTVVVHCGQDPIEGAVVLALRRDGIVVHRVVWRSRRRDWLLTRGDARAIPDMPLGAADVVGVVDAAPFVSRTTQTILLRIVGAAASLGRRSASVVVRALQVLFWVRNSGGVRI